MFSRIKNPPRASLRSLFAARQWNSAEAALHLVEQYGPFVKIHPFQPIYLLADAEAVEKIFLTDVDHYTKDMPFYYVLMKLFGRGLLTSEGHRWQAKRICLQTLFTPKHLLQYQRQTILVTDRFLSCLDEKVAQQKVIAIDQEMLILSLMITVRLFFLEDISYELATEVIEHFTVQHCYVVKAALPNREKGYAREKLFKRANIFIDAFAEELLLKHSKENDDHFVSKLMNFRDPDSGRPYTTVDKIDEIKTFLGTGHDTVGTALGWAFHSLLTTPVCYEKLKAEVDVVLGRRIPEPSDLENLSYAGRVFQETIRLYPPIWMLPRKPKEAVELAGYQIAANASLLTIPYVIHRLPIYWQNPAIFNPDRFSPLQAEPSHKFAYLPFGAGRRMCIARALANDQARFVLAMMMQRYRMTLDESCCIMPTNSLITLKPRYPILVHCEKRGVV